MQRAATAIVARAARRPDRIVLVLKSARLLCLLLTFTLLPTQAVADDERSVGWAYASSIGGFLVPTWIGMAVAPANTNDFEWNARWTAAAASYYASLCWGTSAGYYYGGNSRYATLSGLGKTGVLATGLSIGHLIEGEGQHPYLVASSLIAIAAWDVVDVILLARDVRQQHSRRSEWRSMPLTGPPGQMIPSLSIGASSIGLQLGGRF